MTTEESDFAGKSANQTIEETDIIRLSVANQQALAAAILDPPLPAPALLRAAAAHCRLIRNGRV